MSVVVPAVTSAWELARESMKKKALAYVEANFTSKYFNWEQRGEPGDELIPITVSQNGKEGEIRPRFEILADEPRATSYNLVVPYLGKEYELPIEKIRQVVNLQLDLSAALAREGGLPVEKVIWHGADAPAAATLGAAGVTVHGIIDAGTGTGTHARPLILDGSTTANDWEHGGAAPKDLSKVASLLESSGFKRPFGLFYPIGAVDAFNYPFPTSDTAFGEKTIKQYAIDSKMFDVVAPLPKDLAGNHIATKAADTSQAFQMYAVALGSMKVLYTEKLGIKSLPYDEKNERGTIRCGARCLPAFEAIDIGGSIYKGVVEIAGIDLSD
jgi:hypothetical protein